MNPVIYINVLFFSIAMTVFTYLVYNHFKYRYRMNIANKKFLEKLATLYSLIDKDDDSIISVTICIKPHYRLELDSWEIVAKPLRRELG